jgi:hypothetical protein
MPGAKQRKKEQLLAKGQKFFAYGFGLVGGSKLVVEDVADVSEDEEDYGEYQLVRAGAEGARTSVWDEGWGKEGENDDEGKEWDKLEGTTLFDEYGTARKAKMGKQGA